jgi:single-stranded-DNA-specific exonuclease
MLSLVKTLGEELGVKGTVTPELVATILATRKIDARVDIESIMRPDRSPLPDPSSLANFEPAVAAVVQAIQRGEKVGINGDYDVDGITSVAQMVRTLRQTNTPHEWEVPDRLTDGYGLNERIVQRFIDTDCKIVLLFDHGTHNHAEITKLRAHGIKVVVFDHHAIGEKLPDAIVVNPAQPECGFSDHKPCASALAFFLTQQLSEVLSLPPPDCGLAALGTIADMVPLRGPNRTVTALGLQALQRGSNLGVRHLAAQLGVYPGDLSTSDVAFYVGPAINAAGRIGNARRCVELLLGEGEEEVQKLARELVEVNEKRKDLQRDQLARNYDRLGTLPSVPAVMVSNHETHHQGVVGLTAQGLATRHARPAFVFAPHHDGTLKGSARGGNEAYDVIGMLRAAKARDTRGTMLAFGGHQAAAGLTIRADGLVDFTKQIARAAREQIAHPLASVEVVADAKISPSQLTPKLVRNMYRLLGPCGQGFPSPKFLIESLTVADIATYAGGRRMLVLEHGERKIRAFMGPELWDGSVRPGSVVSLVGTPAALYKSDKHHVQLAVDGIQVVVAPREKQNGIEGARPTNRSVADDALKRLNPPSILRTREVAPELIQPASKFGALKEVFLREMRALPSGFLHDDLEDLVDDPFARDVTPARRVAGLAMRDKYGLSALKLESFAIRPEQLEFIRWFLDRSDNAILQAPTGSGKTEMALVIASLQRSRGYRTIFCAPTLEIQQQVHSRVPQMMDVESTLMSGEVSPQKRDKIYAERDPAFISAIPHVIRNDIERGSLSLRPTDLVVIDEGHHTVGEYPYVPLIKRAHEVGARVLLLSATPGQVQPERSWSAFESLKRLVGVEHIFPVNIIRQQPNVRSLHRDLTDEMKVAIEHLSRRLTALRAEVMEYLAHKGGAALIRDARDILGANTVTFPSATTISPLIDRVRRMNNERERWDAVHALCGIVELSELYQTLAYQGISGFLLRVLEKRLEMKFPVAAVQTGRGTSFLAPKRSLSLVYASREVELAYRHLAVGPCVGVWGAASLENLSGLSLSSWGRLSAKERRSHYNQGVSATVNRVTEELIRLDYSDHPKERYLMEVLPLLPSSDQSIVFVRDRSHALFLAARLSHRLEKKGRVAVALTGTGHGIKKGLSRSQRQDNMRDIADGKARIIVSTSAGNEGIDFARVQHGYAYRFSASPIDALQQWGRVGRRIGAAEVVYLCSAPEEHGKCLSILRKVAEFYKMLNQERQAILDSYRPQKG